jgi:TRAP-type C4-dicarboxylate transport system permease large subunit
VVASSSTLSGFSYRRHYSDHLWHCTGSRRSFFLVRSSQLIISFFFIVIIYGWAKINPGIAPKGEKSSWGERARACPEFVLVGIIFLIVMGGLMKGVFSPTEAGTIGTVAVLILALTLTKGQFTFKGLIKSFDESLRTSCMVLMLIASSNVLGHFLAVTEIPLIAMVKISVSLTKHCGDFMNSYYLLRVPLSTIWLS